MTRLPKQMALPGLHLQSEVRNIAIKGITKYLRLQDGLRLEVHRYACVGKGDLVKLTKGGSLWVKTHDGDAPVLPSFTYSTQHEVAKRILVNMDVHEITTPEDDDAYKALSEFHYRSSKGFGRRAILLLTSQSANFPQTLGFIEITTPFLHLRNRSLLFNAPFSEPTRDIEWTAWNKDTSRQYIHLLARISRIVIHPEVRSLGLSKVLIDGAERYCSERWQVDKTRPLFLEITADMLRFMPFVRSAGMRWIGESPGNLDRIRKDMEYLADVVREKRDHWINRPNSKGIASKQRKDVLAILKLSDELETRGINIFAELEKVVKGEDTYSEIYERLLPMIRYPKPTYIKGLTPNAQAFIVRRACEENLVQPVTRKVASVASCSGPIRLKDATLEFGIDTGELRSADTGRIRQAFGLSRDFRFRTGIHSLTFEVWPGQICFLYGASGAGKTWLLKLIKQTLENEKGPRFTGKITVPSDGVVDSLDKQLPDRPLLQAIGPAPLEDAIESLNIAGLSEPRLYLSRYDQLSAGQQYRAQLARLLCSDSNIWLLDEFASNLDDATAIAVGRNFARAARAREAICFIASIRRSPLVNAIRPDLVVQLNQIGKPIVTDDWRTWGGIK